MTELVLATSWISNSPAVDRAGHWLKQLMHGELIKGQAIMINKAIDDFFTMIK